jgi:hypothetical protein
MDLAFSGCKKMSSVTWYIGARAASAFLKVARRRDIGLIGSLTAILIVMMMDASAWKRNGRNVRRDARTSVRPDLSTGRCDREV